MLKRTTLFITFLAIGSLFASCGNAQENKKSNKEVLDVNVQGSFGTPAFDSKLSFDPKMGTFPGEEKMNYATDIITGAQKVNEYLPLLKGKKVCVLSNQSGMIEGNSHVLDTLVANGINVTCIMSPEHEIGRAHV